MTNDSSDLRSLIRRFCSIWGIDEISPNIHVEYSPRVTRALGRTQVRAKTIRLNPDLNMQPIALLEQVLCHELAHIAARYKYGSDIRPHGPEWKSLVREAGFEPSLRMNGPTPTKVHKLSKRFIHRCPVCHCSRYARRPMAQWRCPECVESGLPGNLVVKETR